MIGDGMAIEHRGRIILDRPKWPTHPADPRYVQAAFDPLDFLDLVELAETTFEPLNVIASALFKLGLAAIRKNTRRRWQAENSTSDSFQHRAFFVLARLFVSGLLRRNRSPIRLN